jgi:hypothetical protein
MIRNSKSMRIPVTDDSMRLLLVAACGCAAAMPLPATAGWPNLFRRHHGAQPVPEPPPPGPERRAKRVVIDRPGLHRFGGTVRRVGRIPWIVEEYGAPALAVRADRARIVGFAWRGSTEGVNVGSEPFDPRGMRRRHKPIRVTLERLWCDDVGEDAVSIQPRARVTLRHSHFRGNHRLLPTDRGDVRGLDKIVQIDGAEVIIEDCDFHHAVCAVRGKANSRIVLRRCRFINCSTCVSGDGLANPRPGNTYDHGTPGPCLITLIDCEAWNCGLLASANQGCEIRLVNCRTHRTRAAKENGGTVRKLRALPKSELTR